MDWEARYENDDTPWDHGQAAPPLVEFLAENRVEGRVLVPGCGSGHDVRALARHGAQPVGLDIAPGAIRKAVSHPSGGAEIYTQGDIRDLSAHLGGSFDWVFEHTCFCIFPHEEDRRAYVNGVRKALKPGGQLLAIFYLRPQHNKPDGPPFGVTPEKLDELFCEHFEELARWTPQKAYPGREGREEMRILRLT